MQKEQVSGMRPCGHLPVVGSTRMSASRCFIVRGLSTFGAAPAATGAAAAGFAGAAFFFGAAGLAAFFAAVFFAAGAFFAGLLADFFFFATRSPGGQDCW